MTGPHLSILNAGLDQLSMTTTPTVIPPSATDDANLDSTPQSNAQPPIQPTSLLNSTKGSPAQQPVGSPALFGLGPIASLDSLPEESMVGAQLKPQEQVSMEHLYQMQIMAQKNQLQGQGQGHGVGLPTPPPQPQAIPAPLAMPQAGSPFHIPLQQGPVPVVASSMSLNLGASPRIAHPAVQGYHYPLSEGYQLPQSPDGLAYREGSQGELVPFFPADPLFGNRTGERGEVNLNLVGGEMPELLALPPPPQTPTPVAVPPPPSHAPKPYQHPNHMDPLSVPPPANPAAGPTGGELSPSPKGSSGKGQKPGKPKKQKGLSRLFSSNKGYQPPPRPPIVAHEPTFLPSNVTAFDEGFDAGYEAGYKAAMAELQQQHQDIAQNLKYEQY